MNASYLQPVEGHRFAALRHLACLCALIAVVLLLPGELRGQEQAGATPEETAMPDETEQPEARTPFELQTYRVKILISFAPDARLTPRLRADVQRRLLSHAAAFVGDAWQIDCQDVSGSLALVSPESIAGVTGDKIEPFTTDVDKVFVLGVRVEGDRILLAAREFDVFFTRWGPVFQGSARESTQVARELVILCARMFSPLARIEGGDAKRVTILIKGGRLPALNPAAVDRQATYKPAFSFVPNGIQFRPMRPVLSEDRTEIIGMTVMNWTFYSVEAREGAKAICRIDSALKNTILRESEDPDDPQLIVARSAGGNTRLRLVDGENLAPLPAIDVEEVGTAGGAPVPLGTTDSDGRIDIPPRGSGSGIVWANVRHGRETMAHVPILPGAGDEPDLVLKPDNVRLDIEGRVMGMQTQIVDQVAIRTILGGNLNTTTGVYEGGLIRKAIEKKDWKRAADLLKKLKEAPSTEAMMEKLEAAKEYARSQREEKKWTNKIRKLFADTETIITEYFNADNFTEIVEELEDDLKSGMEEAGATAAEGESSAPPAAGSSQPAGGANKS